MSSPSRAVALEQLVTWFKLSRRIVPYLTSGFADFDGKNAGPIPGPNFAKE